MRCSTDRRDLAEHAATGRPGRAAVINPAIGLMEDPRRGPRHIQAAGAAIVPVPVDDDGSKSPRVNAHRTPGSPTDARHRHRSASPCRSSVGLLLEWAAKRGAWIIEDDYDSEYRYDGRPFRHSRESIGPSSSFTGNVQHPSAVAATCLCRRARQAPRSFGSEVGHRSIHPTAPSEATLSDFMEAGHSDALALLVV